MEDGAILLKLKRDFTTNEAVQSLLKMVSELEMEIGRLKSELTEAQDKAERIRSERTLTKKQWMQEEIFIEIGKEREILLKKVQQYKKSTEDWRNKYFSIMAKNNDTQNTSI